MVGSRGRLKYFKFFLKGSTPLLLMDILIPMKSPVFKAFKRLESYLMPVGDGGYNTTFSEGMKKIFG